MQIDTYIKLSEGPVDGLGVDAHDIVVWLSGNGSLVEACNGAFGELNVRYRYMQFTDKSFVFELSPTYLWQRNGTVLPCSQIC